MALTSCAVLFIFVSTFRGLIAIDEPVCTSRFDFEEKLLRKLVRMEHAVELLQERVNSELSAIKEGTNKIDKEFYEFKEAFITKQTAIEDNLGKMNMEIEQEKLKLADDFKTLSQQYESKIRRLSSGDLTEALKSLNNEKIVFAVQQATGRFVNGVPTFQKVHVNVGNGYDINTGRFTCSKKGIYSFTLIIRTATSSEAYCYIRLNGKKVNYAVSAGSENMASVTVYLHLTSGDAVDVGSCFNWNYSKTFYDAASFLGMQIN